MMQRSRRISELGVLSEVTEALQPYLLQDVDTVVEDECSSAAGLAEVEVEYKGLRCSALRLEYGEEKARKQPPLMQRVVDVCEILARLRHPNIIQFLGVSYDLHAASSPRSYPMIVNELSPTSLAATVARNGVLPNELSYSILRDVALGLRYLHEQRPSFVHGDLSAKSILLTGDFTAKISRVGVAHLVKHEKTIKSFYLPPEVTEHCKRFDRKVDVFSFGIIMLHAFTGRPPVPKISTPSPERGEEDCSTVSSTSLKIPSQADMRVDYINDLGFNHPIMDSILQCLRNQPILRPEIWEISQSLCKQASSHRNIFRDGSTHRDILYSLEKTRKDKFRKFSTQISSSDSAYGSVSETEVEELQIRVRRLSAQNETLRRLSLTPENMFADRFRSINLSAGPLLPEPLTPDKVKLDWERCADLPVGMFRAQAAVIAGCVYVGGGLTEDEASGFYVFEYKLNRDTWSLLPPLPVKQFGLGKLLDDLVVVGGQRHHDQVSDKTYLFDRYTQTWRESAASLQTPRFSPVVVDSENTLVVMGGLGRDGRGDIEILSSVEVFSLDCGKWVVTGDLPGSACVCSPSPALEDGTLYLLGGYRAQTAVSATCRIHSCPLSALSTLSGTHLKSWKLLPSAPHLQTTAVTLNKCLLALGGSDRPYSELVHDSINAFDTDTQEWREVDQLPYRCCHCTAVAVSTNEVIVLGGWVRPGERKASRSVFRGKVATNNGEEDPGDYITLPAITITS